MAIQLVSFDDYLRYIGETSVTNESQTKSALRDAQAYADQYTDRSLRAYDGDDAAEGRGGSQEPLRFGTR